MPYLLLIPKKQLERLKNNGKLGIPISKQEQQLIIEFLNTLTDRDFVSNELF